MQCCSQPNIIEVHKMASAFYNDDKILQEQGTPPPSLPSLDFSIDDSFDVAYTADSIVNNNYTKIALQFPDELLSLAPAIVAKLKKQTSNRGSNAKRHICILGDTSYGACCVDEVAAQHMGADFIVHYGRACMSKTTRLPVLYVFGKKKIDLTSAVQAVCNNFTPETKLLAFYDVGYHYVIPELEKLFLEAKREHMVFAMVEKQIKRQTPTQTSTQTQTQTRLVGGTCNTGSCSKSQTLDEAMGCGDGNCNSSVASEDQIQPNTSDTDITNNNNETSLPENSTKPCNQNEETTSNIPDTPPLNPNETILNGRKFTLLPGTSLQDYTFLYIGTEDATLTNLMMTNNKAEFFVYNPETNSIDKQGSMTKSLIRRYHYIEKARDADIIGIVVATLGVEGYMNVIEHMQSIIKAAEKKSYMIVVGKLNEFKLGNFQEIDLFVIVACNENTLIDSKNYYKPVITPFELEIALVRGKEWTGEYMTDFKHILQEVAVEETSTEEDTVRFSLNSQKVMKNPKHIEVELETSTDVATRNNNVEMVTTAFATSYLASRSWRGLEQHIGETPVSTAVEGRSGIASVYEGEPK